MKKFLLFLAVIFASCKLLAQTAPSKNEKTLTDSICNCLSKVDLSKVNNKQEAVAVFTDCFSKRTDLLMAVADERHLDFKDKESMRQIGIDVGKELLRENCSAFTQISIKMVQNNVYEESKENIALGTFKRVDIKGFNYIVIIDNAGNEKSFLWLEQFSGSEKFTSPAKLFGKKLSVRSKDIDVYLPAAKGYYKIKEITGIDIL